MAGGSFAIIFKEAGIWSGFYRLARIPERIVTGFGAQVYGALIIAIGLVLIVRAIRSYPTCTFEMPTFEEFGAFIFFSFVLVLLASIIYCGISMWHWR